MTDDRPSRGLAAALFAEPGQCVGDSEQRIWRWSGDDWEPVRRGDTVLAPDRKTWFVWDGEELVPAMIEPGAVVQLDWHRDGLDWNGQLCDVVDAEQGFWNGPNDPALLLLVRPWPDDGTYALVPSFIGVQLVAAPVSGGRES